MQGTAISWSSQVLGFLVHRVHSEIRVEFFWGVYIEIPTLILSRLCGDRTRLFERLLEGLLVVGGWSQERLLP